MNTETIKKTIKDLTEIRILLTSKNPIQNEINTKVELLCTKSNEMCDYLSAKSHPLEKFSIKFLKFVSFLKWDNIELPKKILIVEGLIPFINDFLDDTKKESLSVTDPVKKNLYLKMVDVIYPFFTENEINIDTVSKNAGLFRNYLICFADIIKTFPKEEGYDEFEKTIDESIELIYNEVELLNKKVSKDLMDKITRSLNFISVIKSKFAVEAANSSPYQKFIKNYPFFTLIVSIIFFALIQ